MNPRFQYWLLTGMAGAVLILVVLNISLFSGNADLQQEINARQQVILQHPQQDAVYRQLAQEIASIVAERGDVPLKSLLFGLGITFKADPGSKTGAAPPPGGSAGPGASAADKPAAKK
jgi:hypothetical protein